MNILTSSSKASQYLFLVFFLLVFFGIVIFSFVKNNSKANVNSPTRRDSRDTPFYEKFAAILILVSLPLGVISFILLENWIIGVVCLSVFVLTIIIFVIFSSITRISISTMMNGNKTTIFYSPREFEARLLEGTLDLTNCSVKFPKGYTPPKHLYSDDSEYDAFSKFD